MDRWIAIDAAELTLDEGVYVIARLEPQKGLLVIGPYDTFDGAKREADERNQKEGTLEHN